MDALGGYGSDTSSSSPSDDGDWNKETTEVVAASAAAVMELSGLLGPTTDTSSSSDDDDEDDDGRRERTAIDGSVVVSATHPRSSPPMDTTPSHKASKRPRTDGDRRNWSLPPPMLEESSSSSSSLSDPSHVTATDGGQSMILWKHDYLSDPILAVEREDNDDGVNGSGKKGNTNTTTTFGRYEQLVSTLPLGSRWAGRLQEEQEFHNPHFFQSVVEYFGIKQPLGSQLD